MLPIVNDKKVFGRITFMTFIMTYHGLCTKLYITIIKDVFNLLRQWYQKFNILLKFMIILLGHGFTGECLAGYLHITWWLWQFSLDACQNRRLVYS